MNLGILDKAMKNAKNRKDTTPTLDAQVVDLPEENENEKQILIERPDNDSDKKVNLPATSSRGQLVPPNPPQTNLAALSGGGELAPLGNRDVAEDVEFTVNKEEPEGIEGYKQAGESWHTTKEPEQKKIEGDEKLAIEDKTEPKEQEETLSLEDKSEKPEYEYVGRYKDKEPVDDEEEDDDEEEEGDPTNTNLRDLLNSGATDFSINDIVESEPDIPHYQYKSLLNRR